MKKPELITTLAARTNLSKAATGLSLDALLDIITKAIAHGDEVALSGFGTFKSAQRTARVGRNPKTGEEMNIAAIMIPRFSAGSALKAAVAGKNEKIDELQRVQR